MGRRESATASDNPLASDHHRASARGGSTTRCFDLGRAAVFDGSEAAKMLRSVAGHGRQGTPFTQENGTRACLVFFQ